MLSESWGVRPSESEAGGKTVWFVLDAADRRVSVRADHTCQRYGATLLPQGHHGRSDIPRPRPQGQRTWAQGSSVWERSGGSGTPASGRHSTQPALSGSPVDGAPSPAAPEERSDGLPYSTDPLDDFVKSPTPSPEAEMNPRWAVRRADRSTSRRVRAGAGTRPTPGRWEARTKSGGRRGQPVRRCCR